MAWPGIRWANPSCMYDGDLGTAISEKLRPRCAVLDACCPMQNEDSWFIRGSWARNPPFFLLPPS